MKFVYRAERISPHITLLTDPTGVYLYLAEGTQSAALIDTGVGFVGLKETVAALTDKPLIVILTHMHPDHAGGASAFERAYAHPDHARGRCARAAVSLRLRRSTGRLACARRQNQAEHAGRHG